MQNRKDELEAARERRFQAILLKLRDAGWAETLDNMWPAQEENLQYHALVRQPKDLSNRIWANINECITEFMHKLRAEQLEQIRLALLAQRVQVLKSIRQKFVTDHPDILMIPFTGDLCFMKEFKSILDLPDEVIVTEDTFSRAVEQLPELCAGWKETTQKEMVELLPPMQGAEVTADAMRLTQVTSVFRCARCEWVIDHKSALHHNCLISDAWFNRDKLAVDSDILKICSPAGSIPWGAATNVEFVPSVVDVLRLIVEACGKDPASTLWEQMDKLDARFGCDACENLVMTWRAAIYHFSRCSYRCRGKTPRLMDEGMELHAIWMEERTRWGLDCIWRCSMCDTVYALEDLWVHIRSKHRIQLIGKQHYYRCPRAQVQHSSWVFTQPPTTQQNAGTV